LLCLDSLENLCSCSFPLILNDVPMKWNTQFLYLRWSLFMHTWGCESLLMILRIMKCCVNATKRRMNSLYFEMDSWDDIHLMSTRFTENRNRRSRFIQIFSVYDDALLNARLNASPTLRYVIIVDINNDTPENSRFQNRFDLRAKRKYQYLVEAVPSNMVSSMPLPERAINIRLSDCHCPYLWISNMRAVTKNISSSTVQHLQKPRRSMTSTDAGILIRFSGL
jgi:hypothetical protein